MRITYVLPGRGLSGGNRIVVSYANQLLSRGHEVSIACFRKPWPLAPRALARRCVEGISYSIGARRDHLNDFRGTLIRVHRAALSEAVPDADVVIATHWLTAEPVLRLPACKGRKFYFLQGYEAPMFTPQEVDATWRMPMRKIVIARWLEALAREKFGDGGAVLVPNALDHEQFTAPPRALQNPPAVGFLYAPSPWKGAAMAAEAVRLARARVPGLQVISFGAKRPTPEVPLPDGTQFALRPSQPRICEIYSRADVWLCPSRSEGFGLPVLEAMACRCPVVSTRCGGPQEFVEANVNGHLVNIDDAPAMAERMLDILSDGARWQRMSEAAHQTSRRFNWNASVDLLESTLAA